jgi:hypothetical protein
VENYDDYSPGAVEALTMVGQAFRQEAMSPSAMPNLVAGGAASDTIFVENPDDLGTASLQAFFRNDGELSITKPFTVIFYRDAALTQPIGSRRVIPANEGPVLGCAWEDDDRESAGVTWENLPVGTHTYWARIDATNAIDESAETDNVTTKGSVTVYVSNRFSERRFVPFVGGR